MEKVKFGSLHSDKQRHEYQQFINVRLFADCGGVSAVVAREQGSDSLWLEHTDYLNGHLFKS